MNPGYYFYILTTVCYMLSIFWARRFDTLERAEYAFVVGLGFYLLGLLSFALGWGS